MHAGGAPFVLELHVPWLFELMYKKPFLRRISDILHTDYRSVVLLYYIYMYIHLLMPKRIALRWRFNCAQGDHHELGVAQLLLFQWHAC